MSGVKSITHSSSATNALKNSVVLGKLGSTYGLKGGLRIISYTRPYDNIKLYSNWKLVKDNHSQDVRLRSWQDHAKGPVVFLEGVEDCDVAARLTNSEIWIERSELPQLEEDSYYWQDLIGLKAIDQNGKCLGNVSQLLESVAHDILVIGAGKRAIMLPYLVPRFVTAVDLNKQTINVNWEGCF